MFYSLQYLRNIYDVFTNGYVAQEGAIGQSHHLNSTDLKVGYDAQEGAIGRSQ